MKILAICFKYGTNSPGGIINKKIFDGLNKNNDIKIITAFADNTEPDTTNLFICSAFPYRPHKIFEYIGNKLKKDVDNIFWEIRAISKIKKILKNWKPDVIYARGVPLAPLNVGFKISKEFNVPLMIHFSDPIPAPIEWKPEIKYRNKLINGIRPILEHASKISFVTKAMIYYQQKVSNVDFFDNSVVLFNPTSEYTVFNKPPNGKILFTYIGSFYGYRKPDSLLEAFEIFSRNNHKCELRIIGNNNHLLSLKIVRENCDKIKILPYSTNPKKVMAEASVLIDVDSNSNNEVFLSSKLLDYISTNRIIISITNDKSPVRDILTNFKNSAIVTSHKKEDIVFAFERAMNTNWSYELFDERKDTQNTLNLDTIVNKTETELLSSL